MKPLLTADFNRDARISCSLGRQESLHYRKSVVDTSYFFKMTAASSSAVFHGPF